MFDINYRTFAKIMATYDQPAFFQKHKLVSRPVMMDLRRRLANTMSHLAMLCMFDLTSLSGEEAVKRGIVAPLYPCTYNKRTYAAVDVADAVLLLTREAPVLAKPSAGI